MRVGLIGAGRRGTGWAAAVRAAGVAADLRLVGVSDSDAEAAHSLADAHEAQAFGSTLDLLDAVDLALVAVPLRDRALVASEALRRGAHALVAWPPVASAPEVEALGRLAEEAGREVAVAHALPIAAALAEPALGGSPTIASVELGAPFAPAVVPVDAEWARAPWTHTLAGACGLLGALARSPARRVDAQAARGEGRALRVLAASFRFRSGLFAHLALRRTDVPYARLRVVDGLGERVVEPFLDGRPARAAEVRQIAEAIAAGRPVPYGTLEAAETLRLTERVLRRIA